MTNDEFSKLLKDIVPLIEDVAGTVPTEDSKWHHAGMEIRSKLQEKQLKKLQRKVADRIGYHAAEFKGAIGGSGTKHEAEVHFMQMIKMHHLLRGLQGKEARQIK